MTNPANDSQATLSQLLLVAAFLAMLAGCTTTPLPIPPTMDPDLVGSDPVNGPSVRIVGQPEALDQPGTIRVTHVGEPVDGTIPEIVVITTGDDGSFDVTVAGLPEDRYFFEFLGDHADIFLVALTFGMDGPAGVADPGPDADNDGSPDEVDCAPEDDTITGSRCP